MEKPILHLNLRRKWFDLIKSGEKREEYRECKPYFHRIFSGGHIKVKGKYYHPTDVDICFSNGYSKDRDQFLIKCEGIRVREGRQEWGAIEGQQYYVLLLGDVLNNRQIEGNT